MSWKRAILPFALSVLCACAEGGTRGSGISTFLLGNVASVMPASGGLAGIRVSVTGTKIATRTEADGSFSLVGPFDGQLTVRFQPASGGDGTLDINVPAAGTLTLNDVSVDTEQGTASADSQDVDFDGIVVSVDCPGGTMVMNSAVQTPGDVDNYVVDLETSMIEDAQGHEVPCAAVQSGDKASLSGHVYPNGEFGHALIVLGQ